MTVTNQNLFCVCGWGYSDCFPENKQILLTEFFELLNLTPKLLKTLFFGISPPTSEDTFRDPVHSFNFSCF